MTKDMMLMIIGAALIPLEEEPLSQSSRAEKAVEDEVHRVMSQLPYPPDHYTIEAYTDPDVPSIIHADLTIGIKHVSVSFAL